MEVRALPVVYACQGCPADGQAARDFAERLDRAGLVEAAWLGTPGLVPKQRYPIVALDGCAEGCALRWLAQRGAPADYHYVLDSQ
jgi:uncharacterized metal-binding protein